MTIGVGPVGAPPAVSGGSGSQPPRILRPNLAHLNALRGSRPAILAQDRPQEIRTIAILDNEPGIVRALGRRMLVPHLAKAGFVVQSALISGEIPQIGEGQILLLTTNTSELSPAERRDEILKVPNIVIAQGVDVLLTDFNMPGLTGEQITQDIRSRGSRGFIIGLTGKPTENTDPFYSAGADLVLVKPIDPFELLLNLFTG